MKRSFVAIGTVLLTAGCVGDAGRDKGPWAGYGLAALIGGDGRLIHPKSRGLARPVPTGFTFELSVDVDRVVYWGWSGPIDSPHNCIREFEHVSQRDRDLVCGGFREVKAVAAARGNGRVAALDRIHDWRKEDKPTWRVHVCRLKPGGCESYAVDLPGGPNHWPRLCWHPDGQRLLIADHLTISVLDTRTRRLERFAEGWLIGWGASNRWLAYFDSNARVVVAGGVDGEKRVTSGIVGAAGRPMWHPSLDRLHLFEKVGPLERSVLCDVNTAGQLEVAETVEYIWYETPQRIWLRVE